MFSNRVMHACYDFYISVAILDGSLCQSCDSIKLTSLSGYIASVVTESSGCGAASCPWVIEAEPGSIFEVQDYLLSLFYH